MFGVRTRHAGHPLRIAVDQQPAARQNAVMRGLYGYIVSAVFMGSWIVTALILGLLAQLIGGASEREDDAE